MGRAQAVVKSGPAVNYADEHEARSADFQSAVSPISNRQGHESPRAPSCSQVPQARSLATQRSAATLQPKQTKHNRRDAKSAEILVRSLSLHCNRSNLLAGCEES